MTVKQKLPHAASRVRRVPLTKADRAFVYQRDQGVCQHCFTAVSRYSYDIDHVKRSVGGGTGNVSNLVLSHQTCNRRRGNRTLEEWRAVLRQEAANCNTDNKITESCANTQVALYRARKT